jgi:preprotein translocase subunit SecF
VDVRQKWRTNLRIIWAIAFKDILDALKNRTTLAIMLGIAIGTYSSMFVASPIVLLMGEEKAFSKK